MATNFLVVPKRTPAGPGLDSTWVWTLKGPACTTPPFRGVETTELNKATRPSEQRPNEKKTSHLLHRLAIPWMKPCCLLLVSLELLG